MRDSRQDIASFFQIWRTDGTTLRRSGPLHAPDLPLRYGTITRPKFWNLTLPSGVAGSRHRHQIHSECIVTEVPPSAPMDVILVVASDTDELDEALGDLAFALLGCGAALLTVIIVIVPRLLRRELGPAECARRTRRQRQRRIPGHPLPHRWTAGRAGPHQRPPE